MNYYNDIDPYCAEWLDNLIKENLIPNGHIDTRSIRDVEPSDLRGYTQCHFFAGIGGWARALDLAGWPADRPIWSASCPCQPWSVAGRRKGTLDDRHLWPDLCRLVRSCRPPVIMGEQVSGKDGYGWLDGVCDDLEAEGYACRAADIPACAVGAPHRRNRLYWAAYAQHAVGRPQYQEHADTHRRTGLGGSGREHGGVADAERGGCRENGIGGGLETVCGVTQNYAMQTEKRNSCGERLAHTQHGRLQGSKSFGEVEGRESQTSVRRRPADGGDTGGWVAHSVGAGLEGRQSERLDTRQECETVERGCGECERMDNAPEPRLDPGRSESVAALRDTSRRGELERRERDGRVGGGDHGMGDPQSGRDMRSNQQNGIFRELIESNARVGDECGRMGNPNQPGQVNEHLQRSRELCGIGGDPQADIGFWSDFTLVGPDPQGKWRRVGIDRATQSQVCGMVDGLSAGMAGVRSIDLLTKGETQRVGKLRALGNAIVPPLAAEFITVCLLGGGDCDISEPTVQNSVDNVPNID